MHPWQNIIAQHGPKNPWIKVLVDHIMWRVPFVFLFVLYSKVMEGTPFRDAWAHCIKTQPSLQWTSLKVWPLLNVPNFTVVPLSLRVLYQNVCIYFWTVYLAFRMRWDDEREKKKLAVKAD